MNTNKPYEIIADTRKMSHQDWLAMRKAGIGGSDCAPAVGLSRWKSPFQLWSEKTDRIVPTKASECLYWGSVMEKILFAETKKRRPELEVHELPAFLRSTEYPYMLANLDGYIKNPDGTYSVLEIKTANAFAAQDWQNGLPIEYYCQIMHYMAVTGMASAYVAVLIGGNTFEIQKYDRDEDMIQHIIQMEKHFWNEYMLKDTPPEATAKDNEFLGQLYPKSEEKAIEMPAKAKDVLTDYEKACHDLALAKEAKEEAEAKLKTMLADAEVGIVGNYKISWKNVSTTRLDSKKVKALLTEEQLKECSTTTTTRKFTVGARKDK